MASLLAGNGDLVVNIHAVTAESGQQVFDSQLQRARYGGEGIEPGALFPRHFRRRVKLRMFR